jgi:beta-glucosidase/6-phospho-beta-glucosidase/beta-galactosidase
MSSIGANAYQFSIARPRIFPEATQTKRRPLELTNSSLVIISYSMRIFIGLARKQTSKRLAVNLPLKN